MDIKTYFHDMRETIKILFSKAVILTYIFVCYAAITDKETPLCTVDPIPAFSVNDVAYPTAMVIQITSGEHLRPTKESSHHIDFFQARDIEYIVSHLSWVSLDTHEIIVLERSLFSSRQGRAPPSL